MEKIIIAALTMILAQQPGEYQVKAVYLFNFGRYVGWPVESPAPPGETFGVCVFGKDPFGASLDTTLQGERIGGKRVIARRIANIQDAVDCRILFISTSESSHLKEALAATEKSKVLTVSDIPKFVQAGGMIQFILDGPRVRFEINRTRVADAGLTLSAELLKVASAVR